MKGPAGPGRARRQIETAGNVVPPRSRDAGKTRARHGHGEVEDASLTARALRWLERRFPSQALRRWVIDVAEELVDGKVAGLREYPADERLTILQLAGAIATERMRQAHRRDSAIERSGR